MIQDKPASILRKFTSELERETDLGLEPVSFSIFSLKQQHPRQRQSQSPGSAQRLMLRKALCAGTLREGTAVDSRICLICHSFYVLDRENLPLEMKTGRRKKM